MSENSTTNHFFPFQLCIIGIPFYIFSLYTLWGNVSSQSVTGLCNLIACLPAWLHAVTLELVMSSGNPQYFSFDICACINMKQECSSVI